MAITEHSNKCYQRVYVNDMIGSTLTVSGKRIVNSDYMGADTIPIRDLGFKDTDAFGNEFYHIDRYQKKTSDNRDTVQGLYEGRDHITNTPCAPCTNTPGDSVDLTTDFCTEFKQIILGTSVLKNNINNHWVRHDSECKVPTARQLDANNIPLPKSNLALFHVARKSDNDFYINTNCVKRSPFSILVPVDAGGLNFTYMNGDFILTIEGDRIISAANTTILVEEEGNT